MCVRAVTFSAAVTVIATLANAQDLQPDQNGFEGWPPVPPLNDQSGIGHYCVHRNLLYSTGDIICVGGEGLVCVPPASQANGARAYWSSVAVNRGDINWTPPVHCVR